MDIERDISEHRLQFCSTTFLYNIQQHARVHDSMHVTSKLQLSHLPNAERRRYEIFARTAIA